jgi:hypothetical protein
MNESEAAFINVIGALDSHVVKGEAGIEWLFNQVNNVQGKLFRKLAWTLVVMGFVPMQGFVVRLFRAVKVNGKSLQPCFCRFALRNVAKGTF